MEQVMQKIRFSVQNALTLHRMTWAAFWALPIGLGICLAALCLSVFSPDSAELAQSVIMQAGVIGSMFGVFGIIAVAAAAVHQTWRGTWSTAPAPDHVPDAGKKALPMVVHSIAPDIIVWREECETPDTFAAKMERAAKIANNVIWAVVIPYRSQVVTVVQDGGKTLQFSRDNEPFKEDLKEAEHLPDGYDCTGESQHEYHRYLGWFCAHWRKYSEVAKVAERAGIGTVINLARVSAVLLFLLFSVGISAQSKTRQVDEALGTRIREIPQPGEQVEFVFRENGREKTYMGRGDGRKEYTEILQSSGTGLARYSDAGGTLLYVRKGGEVVAKGVAVGDVATGVKSPYQYQPSTTGDPVRPRSLPGAEPAQPAYQFNAPDSMEIAERLERAKRDIEEWGHEGKKIASPVWDFVVWAAIYISALIWFMWGMCYYVAKTAANESIVSTYGRIIVGGWIVTAQQNAAGLCLIFAWLIVGFACIDAYIVIVSTGAPWLAVAFVWPIILWIGSKITDKMVPNIRVVGNGGRDIITY